MTPMFEKPILLTNGDSWTFGSEIVAPEFLAGPGEKGYGMGSRLKKGRNDTDVENDHYRVPRIWPTFLANSLGFESVNLAWPARSNDGIYDSTVAWILTNYIVPKRPTTDLLVVVGWSSPERKNIVLEDRGKAIMQTIWPSMRDLSFYDSHAVKDYFKFYVNYLWTEYEYIGRFVEQNYNLQNFCERYGINYFCFNSFYQVEGVEPSKWFDINITKIINKWYGNRENMGGWNDPAINWDNRIEHIKTQWKLVNSDRFIMKDHGSFKNYIDINVPLAERMINWHPSPLSHEAWASFLHSYMLEHEKIKDIRPNIRFKNFIGGQKR